MHVAVLSKHGLKCFSCLFVSITMNDICANSFVCEVSFDP